MFVKIHTHSFSKGFFRVCVCDTLKQLVFDAENAYFSPWECKI